MSGGNPIIDIICACGSEYHQKGDPFYVQNAAEEFIDAHKECPERLAELVRLNEGWKTRP